MISNLSSLMLYHPFSQCVRDLQRHFITLVKAVGCSGGCALACVLMSEGITVVAHPGGAMKAGSDENCSFNSCPQVCRLPFLLVKHSCVSEVVLFERHTQ